MKCDDSINAPRAYWIMAFVWNWFVFHWTVGPPYTLRLKVKFYSSEPNTLREELTRYQFFLQLKQDLLEGRLHSKTTDHSPNFSFEKQCAELCALALQCKYLHLNCIYWLIAFQTDDSRQMKSSSDIIITMKRFFLLSFNWSFFVFIIQFAV